MAKRNQRQYQDEGFFDRVLDRFVDNATSRSLTATWVFTLTLLMTALLGTWNFVPMVISDFILGVLMVFGGTLMFFETVFEGKENTLESGKPSDVAGILTSIMATLYGVGLVSNAEFFTTHFSGVQGSAILILTVFLVYEGIGNRA